MRARSCGIEGQPRCATLFFSGGVTTSVRDISCQVAQFAKGIRSLRVAALCQQSQLRNRSVNNHLVDRQHRLVVCQHRFGRSTTPIWDFDNRRIGHPSTDFVERAPSRSHSPSCTWRSPRQATDGGVGGQERRWLSPQARAWALLCPTRPSRFSLNRTGHRFLRDLARASGPMECVRRLGCAAGQIRTFGTVRGDRRLVVRFSG